MIQGPDADICCALGQDQRHTADAHSSALPASGGHSSPWSVGRDAGGLLGSLQSRSCAWDDQQVLLSADPLPLQSRKCSCPQEGHEQKLQCHD